MSRPQLTLKAIEQFASDVITTASAHERYISALQAELLSEKTVNHHKNTFRNFKSILDHRKVENIADVTADDIRAFIITFQSSGFKPKTLHGMCVDIKSWFKWMVRQDILDANPMDKVDMPRLPKEIKPAFTPEELRRLEDATSGKDISSIRDRALIYFLLDTGLRLEECATVKLAEIDLDNGLVKVIQGKGNKDGFATFGKKTTAALQRYLGMMKGQLRPTDTIWIGKYGALSYSGIYQALAKIGEVAKVHCHTHKFRRTCGIEVWRNSGDLYTVQKKLRHADLQACYKYMDSNEDDLIKIGRKFDPLDNMSKKR